MRPIIELVTPSSLATPMLTRDSVGVMMWIPNVTNVVQTISANMVGMVGLFGCPSMDLSIALSRPQATS